jgi:hypothetical protein
MVDVKNLRHSFAVVVASLVVAGLALPARAASNDIQLLGLIKNGKEDDAAFKSLAHELGLVMTPSSLQPAETTGQSGFDFGLDYTFHTMNFDQAYWRDARQDPSVPLLMTLGARARKGFVLPVPLTSEVEFGALWLVDSQLLNLGTNIRVALNEGFRWIPDLAVQAGINRMVGSKDLDLFTVTAGGQISKGFGIMGSVNLCPFIGYQSVWVNASSRIVDAGPEDQSNVDDNAVFDIVDLRNPDNRLDRFSFGARLVIAVVTLTGGLDMNRVVPVGGSDPQYLLQYGVRAGVTF